MVGRRFIRVASLKINSKLFASLLLLTVLVITGFPKLLMANQVGVCLPVSIEYKFPSDPVLLTERKIELVLQHTNECGNRENQTRDYKIKQVFYFHGERKLSIPTRCIPKEPIDLNSIVIEDSNGLSFSFKEKNSHNRFAIYYLDEEFICLDVTL